MLKATVGRLDDYDLRTHMHRDWELLRRWPWFSLQIERHMVGRYLWPSLKVE